MTQYFGGVPGDSVLASYAIAGSSAFLVAAIAVTLSATRTAGRRAVFVFYIAVVVYLSVTVAIDLYMRRFNPVGPGVQAMMAREAPLFAWTAGQPDSREGVVSFLEKRAPKWTLRPSEDLPEEI